MPQTSWHLRKIFISGAPKGAAAAAATGAGAIADFVLRKPTVWGNHIRFCWLKYSDAYLTNILSQDDSNNFKSFNEDIYAHFDYGQLS